MKIEIELFGLVGAKKNKYRAVVRKTGKHKGKAALVKDHKLRERFDYLVEQVPHEYWDLHLQHPKITMQRFCPIEGFNSDRDGCLTSILDEILVRLGIITNDDDLHNNGLWIIHPTQLSEETKLIITLEAEEPYAVN